MARLSIALLLVIPLLVLGQAAEPPGGEWKFDVIYRKHGQALKGLVVEQGVSSVKVRCISRRPGSPTVVFTEAVPRSDISRMVLLDAADREVLQQRLEAM